MNTNKHKLEQENALNYLLSKQVNISELILKMIKENKHPFIEQELEKGKLKQVCFNSLALYVREQECA